MLPSVALGDSSCRDLHVPSIGTSCRLELRLETIESSRARIVQFVDLIFELFQAHSGRGSNLIFYASLHASTLLR